MLKKMQDLKKNTELLEKMKAMSEESTFFDWQSPSVRARRQTTRVNFEAWVETQYDVSETEDIWTVHTIVERSKLYLSAIPTLTQGRLGPQVKLSLGLLKLLL